MPGLRPGFSLHPPRQPATLRALMSSKHFKIAALAGDGIGPEVMREAMKVLRVAEKQFAFKLEITEAPVGWAALISPKKRCPTPHSRSASTPMRFCSARSACRIAIRRSRRSNARARRAAAPAQGIRAFSPTCAREAAERTGRDLPAASRAPGRGIDILVVRELTAGLYFGPKSTEEVVELHELPHKSRRYRKAVDTMVITCGEIERIAHVAFQPPGNGAKKSPALTRRTCSRMAPFGAKS